MRPILLAAVSALALAACSKPTELASDANGGADPAAPAAEEPAAQPADEMAGMNHEGHDMANMPADMAAADAADDMSTEATPDQHTFHTYPERVETVRLPDAAGGSWTFDASNATFVEVQDAQDVTLDSGEKQFVVKFKTLASGNSTVVFEHRASTDAADPVDESRTINFMIH